ncbi:membrane dipeptidase [Novosphingobium sp. PhB165]|uniref:dipeptidase n=1 Tax=Novosphingobium sp. PhB165 TaxID=2485105 RepID=UPI0010F34A93|nr:dipeptidase [Novosphingobium sp. PhB165]TCM19006.1 membrane dipeptidase [Novosphingobium sp. PhB165]
MGKEFRRAGKALTLMAIATMAPIAAQAAPSPEQVAEAALRAAPVWDGHNDVPEQLRARRKNILAGFDFRDTTNTADPAKGWQTMHTDLTRLRKGHVGAQFWSVYVSASLDDPHAVQATLEQIDVAKRLIASYPQDMQLATSAADVEKAMKAGKIASLLGMEGGHSIGGSLGVLRQMYALGARYMTLTHFKNTAWADSATDKPEHDGLTDFGRDVVREMQRIGILVDLSHTSEATMRATLAVAKAPVMFSHSNARAINHHSRNVSDPVLKAVAANGGIVMVNIFPTYVVEETRQWLAARAGEKARQDALNIGDPAAAEAALKDWETAHPMPRGTIKDVADNIDHIIAVAGIDHVGLGGDFDGVETTVVGMEDVSTYPALFAELARRGHSQADLEKISSGNMLRVMKAAEAYAAAHRGDPPIESPTTF